MKWCPITPDLLFLLHRGTPRSVVSIIILCLPDSRKGLMWYTFGQATPQIGGGGETFAVHGEEGIYLRCWDTEGHGSPRKLGAFTSMDSKSPPGGQLPYLGRLRASTPGRV